MIFEDVKYELLWTSEYSKLILFQCFQLAFHDGYIEQLQQVNKHKQSPVCIEPPNRKHWLTTYTLLHIHRKTTQYKFCDFDRYKLQVTIFQLQNSSNPADQLP